MRFLNDMCIDVRVTSWLNSQGHDATHLRDEGLQRLPNGEIFNKAIAESRVIVTFDLDFGEIVALSKGRRTGVILFRLRNIFRPSTTFDVRQMSRCVGKGSYRNRRRDASARQRISIDKDCSQLRDWGQA